QDKSSESEWWFEDGPGEAAQPVPPATTAPRLPIPPRPLEQRQDLVQPWPARPTGGDESEWRSEQGHGTAIPPGRSLLPEPDTSRSLDAPLTSPRYSRDAQPGRESGAGYRSDWLSRLEGITRPMTSPPAPPGPASLPEPPVQPAQPFATQQPAEPGLGATPQPGHRSWGFDPSVTPGAAQAPIPRPTEVPDRSPAIRPDELPGESSAGRPGESSAGWPGAPAVSEPASPSADLAASQLSGQPEPAMRSVWEPLT